MAKLETTEIFHANGFKAENLGAGYAHCKYFPKTVPMKDNVFNMVHITNADDCSNGRVTKLDTNCIVFLDFAGEHGKRSRQAKNVQEAIEIANGWYSELLAAA